MTQPVGVGSALNLYLLFHARRKRRRPVTLVGFVRLCLRRPRVARQLASGWAIALFAGSPLVHVSVGDGSVVLSTRVDGPDRAYPMDPFIETAPGLAWMVVVPCADPVDLRDLYDERRKSLIRTFVRRLTRGRVQTRDCVTTASNAIRRAGYSVPPRLTTPAHLFAWLRENGHECYDLEPPEDEPEPHEPARTAPGRPRPRNAPAARRHPGRPLPSAGA